MTVSSSVGRMATKAEYERREAVRPEYVDGHGDRSQRHERKGYHDEVEHVPAVPNEMPASPNPSLREG